MMALASSTNKKTLSSNTFLVTQRAAAFTRASHVALAFEREFAIDIAWLSAGGSAKMTNGY